MAKKFVTAVFDRRKEVEKKGTGNVEILIYVSLKCRKLIPMKRVTPQEWLVYQDSKELNEAIGRYEAIVSSMVFLGEEMTLANLNSKLGITKKENELVKVLGDGELTKALIVRVDKVSANAKAKIEAAGGKVEEPC